MMDYTDIQEKARCNWCLNPMTMSESITEANFVPVKGKRANDGKQAVALYCSSCLANEQRVSQPKAAIDKNTLQEINVQDLPELETSYTSQDEEA